jgi:hypothetical protein
MRKTQYLLTGVQSLPVLECGNYSLNPERGMSFTEERDIRQERGWKQASPY